MSDLSIRQPSLAGPAVLGVAAIGGYVAALAWSMEHATYDVWGALVSIPILVAASIPLLRRAASIEQDRWFTQVLVLAFVVKLAGGLVRYFVIVSAYGGVADANSYSDFGRRLSQLWLHGHFDVDTHTRGLVGTGFTRLLTAAVYTVSGPSKISGYVVFSWLGFWGLYFCYRAFRIALPDGDRHRYALLVFFLPSLVFWPSSIGKEAWMTLCVGVVALGAARLYARMRGSYLLLALGLVGGALARPHIVVFAVAGVLVGYVLGPRRRRGPASAMWKAIGVAVLATAAFVLLHRAAGFLGLTRIDSDQIQAALRVTAGHTFEGGGAFTATPVNSPLDFPMGLVTVLFRPFPFEAHNAQALVSSIEGLFLIALMLTSWRRLARVPALILRRPFVAFSVVYIVLFVYAFSVFGNFGILVRERVQVLPFLLLLAALPRRQTADRRAPAGRAAARPALRSVPS